MAKEDLNYRAAKFGLYCPKPRSEYKEHNSAMMAIINS